jgi:hypothetical protein
MLQGSSVSVIVREGTAVGVEVAGRRVGEACRAVAVGTSGVAVTSGSVGLAEMENGVAVGQVSQDVAVASGERVGVVPAVGVLDFSGLHADIQAPANKAMKINRRGNFTKRNYTPCSSNHCMMSSGISPNYCWAIP